MKQTSLWNSGPKNNKAVAQQPNLQTLGLTVQKNFLSSQQEKTILQNLEKVDWSQDLKRPTLQFGFKYNYKTKKLEKADSDIPCYLAPLVAEKGFDQLIINKYEKGQGISKHTDHPSYFCNEIWIVSLQSDCVMSFEKKGQVAAKVKLERRSMISLKDEIRYDWTHEISRVTEPRISLTFRRVYPSLKEQLLGVSPAVVIQPSAKDTKYTVTKINSKQQQQQNVK